MSFLGELKRRNVFRVGIAYLVGAWVRVLEASEWKISGAGGAAELLGIKPSTFAYRMKIFGIDKPSP